MANSGKYYDGKSSKSFTVLVKEEMGGIKIYSTNASDGISRFWKLENVSTQSFSTGDKLLLSYGDFPHERLEIDGDFARRLAVKLREHESNIASVYQWITKVESIRLVLGSVLLLGAVLFTYIAYISPWVGEQAVKILPLSVEEKAGEVMYRNMSYMVDPDSAKSELLKEFFEVCEFETPYNIRIDYAKDEMVNAFAIPGGQIVIYEGLIRKTESWDELAALMGHELAHVNERHSFKQIARSISSYFLISVLTGDVAGASSVVLDNAAQIHELSNSRAHEREADLVGLEYLQKSKIRPSAMIDLFRRLQEGAEEIQEDIEETTGQEVDMDFNINMEYLQTHPATANRMTYIQDIIDSDESYNYTPSNKERAKEIWQMLKENLGTEIEEEDFIHVLKRKIGWESEED